MPLTNAQTQKASRDRRGRAYDYLKEQAMKAGYMTHSLDAEGFDKYMDYLEENNEQSI